MVEVLLVESDEESAELTGKILEREGAEVDLANSYGEIENGASGYDTVVADFMLGGAQENGLEIFEKLSPEPRKVLYTGLGENDPQVQETEVDYVHITKPGYDELIEEVLRN